MTTTATFSVTLWGSKPGDNDDCWTGQDFNTIEEAMACFNNPFATFHGPNGKSGESYYGGSELWIELDGFADGSSLTALLCKGHAKPNKDWQREQANEAGMLHGIEAYNDAMGF